MKLVLGEHGPRSEQEAVWDAVKRDCALRFGFSPRTWLMRECAEVTEALRAWHQTGVFQWPPYYAMMRDALETGECERLKPITLNGKRLLVD
jgi:hypothetical protein